MLGKLGELGGGIIDKIGGVKDRLLEKGAEMTADATMKAISGLGNVIIDLEGIFIIVAMIGIFLVIADHKKLGTKLSSGSILLYFLGRMLANVHK